VRSMERERMMRASDGEPLASAAAAMRCGAALVVLALLAVIAGSAGDPVALQATPAPPAAVTATGGVTANHRRQVFDERRARWDGVSAPRLALDAPPGTTAAHAP